MTSVLNFLFVLFSLSLLYTFHFLHLQIVHFKLLCVATTNCKYYSYSYSNCKFYNIQ